MPRRRSRDRSHAGWPLRTWLRTRASVFSDRACSNRRRHESNPSVADPQEYSRQPSCRAGVPKLHRPDSFERIAPRSDLDVSIFNGYSYHRIHEFQLLFRMPFHRRLGLTARLIEMLVEVAFAMKQRDSNQGHPRSAQRQARVGGGISSSGIHRLPIVIFSGIVSIRTGDCRLQTADQRLAFCWLQPGLRIQPAAPFLDIPLDQP